MTEQPSTIPTLNNPGSKEEIASGESLWQSAWRSLRRNPVAMFGLIGLVLLILGIIAAPLITSAKPTDMDFQHILEPPSAAHIFGTDDLGRDTFSRVLWGGRESLRVSFLAVLVAAAGGIVVGLISGYYGGWVDSVIMRIVDVLLAFPAILLILSIVTVFGPSLGTVLIALGISSIPGMSRFVRGLVLAAKNLEYITAAEVLGASKGYIMFSQILPNIMAPLIIYSTLGLGSAIMITAGLSYIGLGAQPPSPEWGALLNYGRTYLREAWWMSVFPGLAIFWAILCINLLGDGLRDALDPKMRI
jgi:peptide/nickel transport system permease protein